MKHFIILLMIVGSFNARAEDFWEGAKAVFGDTKNGYGKIIWPYGQPKGTCPGKTYEGYFKDGLPNGYGKLLFPATGCIYFGEFKNGKQDGIGTLRWPNGEGYTGEYRDGEPSGTGFSVSADGGFRISKKQPDAGLTLLPDGELEREDIYGLTPTPDTNYPTGVFIPKDLESCFQELQKMLTPELIEKMKKSGEDDMIMFHHSLGQWMRNNWGLWSDSRLAQWFNGQKIMHADDMSSIVLTSFWRHLNDKPIELSSQIQSHLDYWEKKKPKHFGIKEPSQKGSP